MLPASHFFPLPDPGDPKLTRRLHYFEYGNTGNPRVAVLVHGLSRNARDFGRLAEALSITHRVLAVDMAGRGDSDRLAHPASYSYPVYAADMLALLAHLKLSLVDWVGTSMGGIIGMMLAAQVPDGPPPPVRRLVLNDIGSIVAAEGLRRILNYVGARDVFESREAAMAFQRQALATFGVASEAEWEFLCDSSFSAGPDGYYRPRYDPAIRMAFHDAALKDGKIDDVDLTPLWQSIALPVLLLRGENSDILRAQTATAMCDRTARTELVTFKDAGHAPTLFAPAQIHPVVRFLSA